MADKGQSRQFIYLEERLCRASYRQQGRTGAVAPGRLLNRPEGYPAVIFLPVGGLGTIGGKLYLDLNRFVMSWDVVILNSKTPVDPESEALPDFPSRTIVIEQISRTFPEADWRDPSWGILEHEQIIVEFNVGDDEWPGNHLVLHVRGGTDPVGEIMRLCEQHGWIALDSSDGEFLQRGKTSGFEQWRAYRDQIGSAPAPKKPWWKFW